LNVNRSAFLGPILILLGVFMLLKGQPVFHTGSIFAYFWPSLFVLPLGVFFHWLYFFILQRRGAGVLVPGGILFTAGIVCQLSMLFNSWHLLWPGFILSVAVGLFELYWFGGRNKWLLIPINILAALSVVFFAVFSVGYLLGSLFGGQPVLAILLIAVGALVLFMRKKTVY